jgi:hypothetical protein
MRYSEFKDRTAINRRDEQELRELATREWLTPDRGVIRVEVLPYDGEACATFSKFSALPGAFTTLRNGRRIEGGIHEYVHDPVRFCSARQLGWLAHAKRICEQWMAGEIAFLPDVVGFE